MCYTVGPGDPQEIQDSNPGIMDNIAKRCKKCSGIKPIRTHHCSICNKCVLQMDRNYFFYPEITVPGWVPALATTIDNILLIF